MKRGSGLLSFLLIFLSISHSQNRAANNSPQLSELLQRAAATHSDAVLVFKDGKPLAEYYSKAGKRKIELMSCTEINRELWHRTIDRPGKNQVAGSASV